MNKHPGWVDATIVLPPWPEVKGKGAGENFKSDSDKDFTNPSEQKWTKILSCDCKQNLSKPVFVSVLTLANWLNGSFTLWRKAIVKLL